MPPSTDEGCAYRAGASPQPGGGPTPSASSSLGASVGRPRAEFVTGRGELATGYALSGDGLWRQHSLLSLEDSSILETTEIRLMYFGMTYPAV
jgi:hypothetical protein